MLRKLLLFLVAIVHVCAARKTLVSVFSHYNVGAGGTNLWKYPAKISLNGRRVQVFPVAVHTSRVSSLKYKVLLMKHKSKKAYLHVVDECRSGDCRANNNKARRNGQVLLDVHKSAMKKLGLSWTLQKATFDVVGTVPIKKLPASIVSPDARKGYLPRLWK